MVILIESKTEEKELNRDSSRNDYKLDFLERLPAFWHVPVTLLGGLKRKGFKTKQGRLKFDR